MYFYIKVFRVQKKVCLKMQEMKRIPVSYFKMINFKTLLSFFCLLLIVNSSFGQDKHDRTQDSDPDTSWVSPNKSVPSFASYQLYPTPERGKDTFGSFMIYLPEEYKNTFNRYPVIYYLHGGNGNQREGKWLMNEIDRAIKAQKMLPVIIVSVQALPIGWYCNANVGAKGVISGPVENVIIKNLVPYIDAHYRTIAKPTGRGLEGWSMGGFGAIRLAFKYPELFGFSSSIAGALIDFQDEPNPQYLVNTFGPATGTDSEKSIEYFNAVNPRFYARKNAELIKRNVKVRLIVGDQDWLYNNNGKLITKKFSDYLDSLGIKHDYTVLKNVGHMIPIEFANGTREYPVQFWADAFKPIITTSEFEQLVAPFNASTLIKTGDEVRYGSYLIRKIGDRVFQINDPGDKSTRGGGWGVDMYLVCGTRKVLLIDLGNNYITGYEKDLIKPRRNAAEELLAVIDGLAGKLPLEIAVTHMHPDHDGMTGAFSNRKVSFWAGQGEDLNALKTQHALNPEIYQVFTQGSKSFDLGGGRIVETFPVRGHSNGGTVYIMKKDMIVFSGDALGSGFGQAFPTIEKLRQVADDSQKLVEYIKSNYTPYERYGLRVYTGHWWQNAYGGFLHPNKSPIDIGYLDWRFIQDVASCANGILQGKWLVEGSGIRYTGNMAYTDAWPSAEGRAIMVCGTGTIIIPLRQAYEAAGLKMPE
jgi:glyoxylase-like metal-dependent hydrolase (beta-lactamase superfamily II)/S-formylglutathione hydrolase FrmB